jgi:hypothetical protein
MAQQTSFREHGAAGLTPTRLEVSESLRAADLETIDEILATPAGTWEMAGMLLMPLGPVEGAGIEDPAFIESLRMLLEDELDHTGLEEEDDGEGVTGQDKTPAEPREHHPVRWGPVA